MLLLAAYCRIEVYTCQGEASQLKITNFTKIGQISFIGVKLARQSEYALIIENKTKFVAGQKS